MLTNVPTAGVYICVVSRIYVLINVHPQIEPCKSRHACQIHPEIHVCSIIGHVYVPYIVIAPSTGRIAMRIATNRCYSCPIARISVDYYSFSFYFKEFTFHWRRWTYSGISRFCWSFHFLTQCKKRRLFCYGIYCCGIYCYGY